MFIYIYDLIYKSLALHHTQTGPIGTRKFSPKNFFCPARTFPEETSEFPEEN